jgi:hypothetical protein
VLQDWVRCSSSAELNEFAHSHIGQLAGKEEGLWLAICGTCRRRCWDWLEVYLGCHAAGMEWNKRLTSSEAQRAEYSRQKDMKYRLPGHSPGKSKFSLFELDQETTFGEFSQMNPTLRLSWETRRLFFFLFLFLLFLLRLYSFENDFRTCQLHQKGKCWSVCLCSMHASV